MAVHIEGQGREIHKGTYGKDIRGPISDALWILYNHGLQATTKKLVTQEEYDALEVKEQNVAYCIYDPTEPVWKDYWISVIMLDGDADTDDIFYCKTLAEARAKLDEYYENDPDAMYRIWIGEECGVTTVPARTFQSCHNMLAFHVPGTVSVISTAAFNGSALQYVTFSDSDTQLQIYNGAFESTQLHSVAIPNRCIISSSRGSEFKSDHQLESVTIGNSLSIISSNMFYDCTILDDVHLPDNVTTIEYQGFYGSGLVTIDINNVNTIGQRAFMMCTKLKNIDLSDVHNISDYAFYYCESLERVEFNALWSSLGTHCFEHCHELETVVVHPGSQYSISGYTFADCHKLKIVVLQDESRCVSIGERAFYNCLELPEIHLPNSISSIGKYAFTNCEALATIEFPSELVTIDEGAFAQCYLLDDVILPPTITHINKRAFNLCASLQSLDFPEGLSTISEGVCYGCRALTHVSIPSSVAEIGANAFEDCRSLTEIVIPHGPTVIHEEAFTSCDDLETVTIGKDVAQIMDDPAEMRKPYAFSKNRGVFYGCYNLKKIIIYRDEDSIIDANGDVWTPKLYKTGTSTSTHDYLPEDCQIIWKGAPLPYDI